MITVVSGVPRSGTSMMMQMLRAGGMPVLSDGVRRADAFNPRGYLEHDRVKRIAEDAAWLDEAEGRAVKVVSWHLPRLPAGREYRVILMERDLDAVVASQTRMLGEAAQPAEEVGAALETHMKKVMSWLAGTGAPPHLRVDYDDCVSRPLDTARRVNMFLGGALDNCRMADAVDAGLRHDSSSCTKPDASRGKPRDPPSDPETLARQLHSLGYL